MSFACRIEFDVSTLPPEMLSAIGPGAQKILGSIPMEVRVENGKPNVTIDSASLPKDNPALAPAVNLMRALASGFWITWPSKGWSGPIPPFTNWVESVKPVPEGYEIRAKSANGLDSITVDHELNVTRIVSVAGTVDEHPAYSSSSEGLVYSGNSATSKGPSGDITSVRYEIESAVVDGFRLPGVVHLHVNDNIDVRFSMTSCSVKKADAVLQLKH